jgi:beta-galactosidase
MASRRQFLLHAAAGTALGSLAGFAAPNATSSNGLRSACSENVSLCGEWAFRTDPENVGTNQSWYAGDTQSQDWARVEVPHTWQVDPKYADYRGIAWYLRAFDAPAHWGNSAIRVEFEAVFHSATVWVNGQLAGEHARKGYTAFMFEISRSLRFGERNVIAVKVDNAFNQQMLPRGRSSDWANDGGVYRPVQLLVTPKTFIEHLEVNAEPDLASGHAALTINAHCRNTDTTSWNGMSSFRIVDDKIGLVIAERAATAVSIPGSADRILTINESLPKARFWHFDSPHLYRLEFSIANHSENHQVDATFGVRKFEIKEGAFHLNGERVHLMGVERMAGSNPQFGMAEPTTWIDHDHCDLKYLNCVFTRVHWPQDKRVLEYCDRHGILMQSEIPAWGPGTFDHMSSQPDSHILENGLEQLREMISRDRNHPSIVVWGLCNEIGGQNPPAYEFAKHMLEEAKRLDPSRLCSYASHSLRTTPARDVAGLMDFIETNEYFGSWQPGTAENAAKHLDELHATFPGKPIVVSEYGYCACTVDRPEGDEHRTEILKTHDAVIRPRDFVGGAIFFCYNDYRTHIGDRGSGPLTQRVHGVVDVYGKKKPSYAVLREESSPVESLSVDNHGNEFHLVLSTRKALPCYALRGYTLQAVFYGQGDIPLELAEVAIPELAPGAQTELKLLSTRPDVPLRVQIDVVRPTRFSAYSVNWTP